VSVLARKLGVVEADLGVIFTINGLASIVGAVPSGYLIDKMPGHLVLAAALAFEVGSSAGRVCGRAHFCAERDYPSSEGHPAAKM
jgi:predicted MFS family arabinose efflux permease